MNRHFVVWILYGGCSVPGTDDAGLVGSEPERDSGADAGAIAALITASSSLADTAAEAAEEPAKAAPTPRPQLVRYGRRVKRPVRPWRKEQPYGPNRQERFSHSRRYGVIRLYL
jgi:hypothetical protein